MFNQLSGINALMYYAPRIFQMAGAAAQDALLQATAIGGTNLVLTIVALFMIDRLVGGRCCSSEESAPPFPWESPHGVSTAGAARELWCWLGCLDSSPSRRSVKAR